MTSQGSAPAFSSPSWSHPASSQPSESTPSGLRNRYVERPSEETSDDSPTSVSTLSTMAHSTFRRPVARPVPQIDPSSKRIVIRADPSVVTCFDPVDKELHDLWAPKH